MKRGKVFFHPIDGVGSLTISWSSLPKGDAVEAIEGSGVGFFSKNGALIGMIFDEVQSEADHQILEFPHHVIEVTVTQARVVYRMTCKRSPPKCKQPRQKISERRKRSTHS